MELRGGVPVKLRVPLPSLMASGIECFVQTVVKICIDCLGLGACIFASNMILAILLIVFCYSLFFSGESSVLYGPMENSTRGQPLAAIEILEIIFLERRNVRYLCSA